MMSQDQHSCLAELNVPGRQLNWSKDIFAAKFHASYKLISEADHVEVGAVELFPELYGGRRWLHWEATAGRVCLREVWLDQDLVDHTVCLQLGGSHLGSPSSVHFECISSSIPSSPHDQCTTSAVRACFVMTDGSVHNLLLESDDRNNSFLAGIIDVKEGSLLESLESDSDILVLTSAHTHSLLTCTHRLSEATLNNQSITSSCFLSHFAIVFGLSDGDVVYLRMASEGRGGGQSVSVETVMRCTGVVQSLWSGLVGSSPEGITPRVMVISGSHLRDSSIAVTYNADGCLRVWDCLGRVCLQKITVLELLGLAAEGQGGVSVEGVKLDTCPMDTGSTSCCLGIVLGVSSRVGRERRWNNVVLSWSPAAPRALQQRARLSPPPFASSPTLLSTQITLEQVSLSPCGSGSRSVHGDTIASLWRVGTEVLPVAHYLPSDHFSWMAAPSAASSQRVYTASAHVVRLGPAERHAQWRQGDQVFDQAVCSSSGGGDLTVNRWNAVGDVILPLPGSGVNVEIDMHYLRTSFLQRLFSPGRFPFHVIVRVITQDIPYDVQQLCAEEGGGEGGYEGLMDLLLARGMDTYVEEKDPVFNFASGALGGGGTGGFSQSAQLESPLEILVQAVISVCGKYEELVLDRLLQKSHHDSGLANLDSRLSTKLKRYRHHSPTLSLQAQVEVCRHVLQLCEDRLCQLRSASRSCSLLVHTRGGGNSNSYANSVVQTPFEFVVVRPTGLGVVLTTSLVVMSGQQRIPNYAEEHEYGRNDISSFVPFVFGAEECCTAKQRLMGLVSEEMAKQPQQYALLDTLLSRYVADVSFFNLKQSQFHCVDVENRGNASGEGIEGMDDDNIDNMSSPQSLSATVQHLFTQSVVLPDDLLDSLLDIFQHAHVVPWSTGSNQEILEAVDTFFGDLLVMPSLSEEQEGEKRNTFETSSHNPMCSLAGAELLFDLSAMTTRSAYLYYQAVACVFLGLLQRCIDLETRSGGHWADVCVLLQDKYVPTALCIVTHYSFINWTGSIHLSASRQLEKNVDCRDLVYNSSLINSVKSSLNGYHSLASSSFDGSNNSSSNISVLLSFWRQFSSCLTFNSSHTPHNNTFWRALGERCLFAVRPSSHSDYTSYLIDAGQYSLATKCSSLSLLREVSPAEVQGSTSNTTTLLQYFSDIHSLAVQRITGVQMYLHDITTAARGGAYNPRHGQTQAITVTLDPSNMEEIKKAIHLLVQLVDLPSSFEDQFTILSNEWSCGGESRISYGTGRKNYKYSLEQNLCSAADIVADVKNWASRCQEEVFAGDNEDDDTLLLSVYALQERDEGILCLSEGLLKLSTTPYFRMLYSAVALMLRESVERCNYKESDAPATAGATDVISILLRCYPDMLLQLHFVSLAMTAHHLVDRSRALLPLHFGVEMALHSGRAAVGVLEQVIQSFTDMFNAWNLPPTDASSADAPCRLIDAALHSIRKELEIVLSSLYANILDISLLSCLFDEGYAAVMNLVVLFHQSSARDQFWTQKNNATAIALEDYEEDKENEEDENAMEVMGAEAKESVMTLQWRASLRSLVIKACSCGQLQWVCDRQDVERLSIPSLVYDEDCGGVVEYEDEKVIDIVKEIVQQFEFVCNSSDFTDYFSGNAHSAMVEGGGGGVNSYGHSLHLLALYDCLAAFLLSKGLRQECARVLYQLVWRLEEELQRGAESEEEHFEPLRILESQSRVLGTAIGALHHEHVRVSQRYIVLRNTFSSREYHEREEGEGGVGDNALLHVTVSQMKHMYLQVQGKISLVRSAASSGGSDGGRLPSLALEDGELVRRLCRQGNYYDAINLGVSAAAPGRGGERGRGRGGKEGETSQPSLEQAISLFAQECSSSPTSSSSSSASLDTISQFASTLGTNLTSLLEFEEKSDAPRFLREYLVHCLQCLDGPESNWSLHAAATAAALKATDKDALSPALIDSYSGFSSSSESDYVHVPQCTSGGLSGNISAFLLQLLKNGYLVQACETATRFLNETEPEVGQQECIPFMVLDRVIDACTHVLANRDRSTHRGPAASVQGARGQGAALAASHAGLVAALENYFNKLLVVEAGGGL